jgi:hypothetical protein
MLCSCKLAIKIYCFFLCVCVWYRDWTQGLMLGKQALYLFSQDPTVNYFLKSNKIFFGPLKYYGLCD